VVLSEEPDSTVETVRHPVKVKFSIKMIVSNLNIDLIEFIFL
jgi:hypothetical protein